MITLAATTFDIIQRLRFQIVPHTALILLSLIVYFDQEVDAMV